MAVVFRAGGLAMALPFGGAAFNPNTDISYAGSKTVIDDGDGNWRIKFLTSETLTFLKDPGDIDLFLVGGGGGGGWFGGAGGGYTNTVSSITPSVGVGYPIVIGAGGAASVGGTGSQGGSTSAFNNSVDGGYGGEQTYGGGGQGGSGGGASNALGGTDGADGADQGSYAGGDGQGTTTKEFAETTGTLYSTGGNGWNAASNSNDANTGNGGHGGSNSSQQQPGGSGIVVIRNHRAA